MKVRFQADNDLNLTVLLALARREPAIDFQAALAAGLSGRPDLEVLAIAARDGRVLVTHDNRTMPMHFAGFIAQQQCTGVIIVPQHLPLLIAVEELLLIWGATEAEEWVNRICYLPL